MYLKNGKVKVELALAKGKKLYDKRQDMAKKMHKDVSKEKCLEDTKFVQQMKNISLIF